MCVTIFQPKPHFLPSSKGGQNTSASTAPSAKPASGTVDQPLSYAEYIVQSKSNVADPPQRPTPSKVPRSEGAGVTSLKQNEFGSLSFPTERSETVKDCVQGTEGGSEGVKKIEEAQMTGTEQKDGNCQRSDPSLSLGPKPVGSGSSIIVSPRQVSIRMWRVRLVRCLCWLVCTMISITSDFVTYSEGKSYSEVCEECPMGVWRYCTRLCVGPDDVCSLPQVGF